MVFENLVDMGIDPNAADFFGRTALCFAAHWGNLKIIDMRFERMKKGGLDQKDCRGRNALVYAILNHQEAAALMLIHRKIQSHTRDQTGKTPLWYAASRGMEKVVEALIKEDETQGNDMYAS